jgi:hypothetical protein
MTQQGYPSRQVRRAILRHLAEAVLKQVIHLPRKTRRIGARAFTVGADRLGRGMSLNTKGRYRKFVLNPQILTWVTEKSKGMYGNA